MRLEVSLTKAEAAALVQRTIRYRTEGLRAVPEDHGPTIDWSHGVRKSKVRQSAERKLLAALESQLREAPDA